MNLKVMETTKIALEDEISRAIMAENGCTAHFDYHEIIVGKLKDSSEYESKVTVMTYNPKTRETFLLKEVSAKSDDEGLMKVSEYVKSHKVDYDSFTVIWTKKGETKQSPSYFYCKDALEALEKFFFNKQREDYIIYSVTMSARS
jgi:hypothetical protein